MSGLSHLAVLKLARDKIYKNILIGDKRLLFLDAGCGMHTWTEEQLIADQEFFTEKHIESFGNIDNYKLTKGLAEKKKLAQRKLYGSTLQILKIKECNNDRRKGFLEKPSVTPPQKEHRPHNYDTQKKT